jgi:hypothetical protein
MAKVPATPEEGAQRSGLPSALPWTRCRSHRQEPGRARLRAAQRRAEQRRTLAGRRARGHGVWRTRPQPEGCQRQCQPAPARRRAGAPRLCSYLRSSPQNLPLPAAAQGRARSHCRPLPALTRSRTRDQEEFLPVCAALLRSLSPGDVEMKGTPKSEKATTNRQSPNCPTWQQLEGDASVQCDAEREPGQEGPGLQRVHAQ